MEVFGVLEIFLLVHLLLQWLHPMDGLKASDAPKK